MLNIYSNGELIECKYTDENNKGMTDIFLRRDLCLLQAEEPSIDLEDNDYHEEAHIKKIQMKQIVRVPETPTIYNNHYLQLKHLKNP